MLKDGADNENLGYRVQKYSSESITDTCSQGMYQIIGGGMHPRGYDSDQRYKEGWTLRVRQRSTKYPDKKLM